MFARMSRKEDAAQILEVVRGTGPAVAGAARASELAMGPPGALCWLGAVEQKNGCVAGNASEGGRLLLVQGSC